MTMSMQSFMNRRFAMFLELSAAFTTAAIADEPAFPMFAGKSVCMSCHAGAGSASVCTQPPLEAHDRAFAALSRPEAESIAALNGVVDHPTESRLCLSCHAAASDWGPRWIQPTFDVQDGVQCETCHGPGSAHITYHRAASKSQPKPDVGDVNRVNELSCLQCHWEKASHREVLKRDFRLRPEDGAYKTPVDVVVSPDDRQLFVACERSNTVAVIDIAQTRVIADIPVGRRPCRLALHPNGRRLFVSNRLSNTVSEIDVQQLRVVRDAPVGAEPHGMASDPLGQWLYVANTAENSISVLGAETLVESHRLAAGHGPWSIAVNAGDQRAFVTSVRPQMAAFREPAQSELTRFDAARGIVDKRHAVADANMLQGVAIVPQQNIVVFTLQRTKNLVPATRLMQGWMVTNGLGVMDAHGRVDQVLLDEPTRAFADPMDIAVRRDGEIAIVSSGGADEVAIVDINRLLGTIASYDDDQREELLPNLLGVSGQFVVKRLATRANPRGVAFSHDGRWAFVANALDDSISVIDATLYQLVGHIDLGGPSVDTPLRLGEKIFHSAANTFGRQFSCRSCHPDGHDNGLTFDIEADVIGLNPVDNRSLRGIFDTAPFKWEGTNPTLHRQCGPRFAVFFTRLAPLAPDDLDALTKYIGTIEQPPNRNRGHEGLTITQRRGKAVFERTTANDGTPLEPTQRCAHCHNGAHMTNRLAFPVGTTMWFDAAVDVDMRELFRTQQFGELGTYYFLDTGMPSKVLDTPALRNVYDSAPYLHNGAAASLEEIWTRYNLSERHGMISDLSREQFNDLIAYLLSL